MTLEDFKFWIWCHRQRGRILHDEPGVWYAGQKPILWAHAGGGRLCAYSNSREAIDDSIAYGLKVLELDVAVTSDGVPVLSHLFRPCGIDLYGGRPTLHQFTKTPICGRYTPLTLESLFENYGDFDGWFAIDSYACCSDAQFDLVNWLKRHCTTSQLGKIIYQVPSLESAKALSKGHPFVSLHYSLPSDIDLPQNRWRLSSYLCALTAFGVHSVSLGNRPISETTRETVRIIRRAGLHVSIIDVDSVDECRRWMDAGADVFNSRLLHPKQFSGDL